MAAMPFTLIKGKKSLEFTKNELKIFLKTCQQLLDCIQQDNFIQILSLQAGIIRSDLTYVDSTGKTQIDMHMLSKLQAVLLPVLAEALKYIPIPRIASATSKREFWIDNIVLSIYDILPENIYLHFESDSHISLRELQIKDSQIHMIIELHQILTELKDMNFYFKKKHFPEFTEKGLVTFRFKGEGAKLRLIFTVTQNSDTKTLMLTQGSAQFNIMEMEIKFDKSTLKHDILVPLFKKFFKKTIQQKIEKEVENNIMKWIYPLAENLTTTIGTWPDQLSSNLDVARVALMSSELGQVFERRRELIE